MLKSKPSSLLGVKEHTHVGVSYLYVTTPARIEPEAWKPTLQFTVGCYNVNRFTLWFIAFFSIMT